MAKRRSVKDLEAEIHDLNAVQEAFFCMRRGEQPVRLAAGDHVVEYLGAWRKSGGVVIVGVSVSYAMDWCARARSSGDVYLREIAYKIERMQAEAA